MRIDIEIKGPTGTATKLLEIVEDLIPELAEAMHSKLVSLAGERLTSSEQEYVRGISEIDFPYTHGKMPTHRVFDAAVITLKGALPVMIETGWDGGDMKAALLAGPRSKTAEDGTRYVRVPFRHGHPGATGRNFQPMGSQFRKTLGEGDAARLGRRVWEEAKKLKAGESLRPRAGGVKLLRLRHETDIYASMRQVDGDKAPYMTWRTVSSRSHPDSWIHPGIAPARLFDEAAKYISTIAPVMIKEAVGAR